MGIRCLLVHGKGLEPSRLAALVPKTSVSTNSTTRAIDWDFINLGNAIRADEI